MGKTYRRDSEQSVHEPPVCTDSVYGSGVSFYDALAYGHEPITGECSNSNCGSERPIEDMTGCGHCGSYYCSGGCYEQHYERVTGRRYTGNA